MSASQQHHINAMLQEQIQLLAQRCEFAVNEHNERLRILESNASMNTNNNCNCNCNNTTTSQMASRPNPARRLSNAMENTIRLSSHKQLADLVVQLCHHDDDTQSLATSLLLDGEGDSDMSGRTSPQAALAGAPKRKAPAAFSAIKTCKNCKEEYDSQAGPRSDEECWYHPGILDNF